MGDQQLYNQMNNYKNTYSQNFYSQIINGFNN